MNTKMFPGLLFPALFLLTIAAAIQSSQGTPPPAIAAISAEKIDTQGGGKPDKGHLDLTLMPSKAFVGDQVTLTADLRAPKDDDGNPKSVQGISIGFNHSSDTVQNPTDSDGTAIVTWDASAANADEDGHILMTAQVAMSHRGDYDKDEKIDGEPENADRRGRDHETFTIETGSVYLLVKKVNHDPNTGTDTPGKETKAVFAGENVFLEAQIKDEGGPLNGKTIRYRIEHRAKEDDPWQGPPTQGSAADQYPGVATTDQNGTADLKTTLQAGQYRFAVWYDADEDGAGYDRQSPDASETDTNKAKGVDIPEYKIVSFIRPVRVEDSEIVELMEDLDIRYSPYNRGRITRLFSYLNPTANLFPPDSFTSSTWPVFVGDQEYRGYIHFDTHASSNSNGIIATTFNRGSSQGYTPNRLEYPGPTYGYDPGVGESWIPESSAGHSPIKVVAFNKFMVNPTGQVFWEDAFKRLPPFGWHKIVLTLNEDATYSVKYSGSNFPNHIAYENNDKVAENNGATQTKIISFIKSPPKKLAEGKGF